MSKSNDHATTDRFSESAHESVDQIAKSAGRAEERIRHEAEDAKDYVKDAKQKTKQRSDEAMNTVSLFVQENPLISLGIAFAAGSLLSALKRRS
ncbi:DUF883 family protein [Nitrincola iocasae]|uniref:DUF883 family protein n=1 Tax=Nitrincola iocasae TaxID=2614693 RepID=A0A5J6LG57_9GAMM|nr:DUF883 family protein [Nitrincola iocasae]QEW07525.1 DUF883 family protein [Nitrincola iocasae]